VAKQSTDANPAFLTVLGGRRAAGTDAALPANAPTTGANAPAVSATVPVWQGPLADLYAPEPRLADSRQDPRGEPIPPAPSTATPPARKAPFRPRVAAIGLALADWVFVAALFASVLAALGDWLDMPVHLAIKVAAVGLCLKIGLWASDSYSTVRKGEGAIAAAAGIVGGAGLGWFAASQLPEAANAHGLTTLLAVAAPITLFLHLVMRWAVRATYRAGDWAETAVIVGATEAARRFIAAHKDGRAIKVVAVFDDRLSRAPETIEGAPVLGDIDALLSWSHLPAIDHIVLTVTPAAEARVRDLIARLRLAPNQVSLLLDFDGWSPEMGSVRDLGQGLPALVMSGQAKPRSFYIAKRAQDVVISLAMLIGFAPLMAGIAIAILLDGPGPILFRQKRHGLNNKIITILKFRTMRPGTQAVGRIEQVQADDPRVTKVGRFLRASSLDELPQLFNVLVGEMSLVGPRPHAVGMRTGSVETCRIVDEYAHRHRLKPGITGWAQINGSRGPVHTEEEVRERVRLDLEYIEGASFWFDLWIMLRTAPALLGDRLRIR
jgi:polysaccharide biosynthesis protein PslA